MNGNLYTITLCIRRFRRLLQNSVFIWAQTNSSNIFFGEENVSDHFYKTSVGSFCCANISHDIPMFNNNVNGQHAWSILIIFGWPLVLLAYVATLDMYV